jgi:predicted MPP superfamily phosphohydrolase
LPGNEVLWLEEVDRGVELARLPEPLEGLSILHLSDLHWTGQVGKSYFAELVQRCNLRQPDLAVITGDFVDTEACLDWVPDTLAKLRTRWGAYFVLGNHDRRVDSGRLRSTLEDAGLVDLGGRWMEVEIRGERIVLAGNEAPWLRPPAELHGAPPSSVRGGPFRIALAHSPDQLGWARREEVDLLLVGHTHGGQVCVPGIGPIFSPCWCGVRYIRGSYLALPTVMHVTQGISAELPVRFHCYPEAAMLVLHAASKETTR